MNFWHNEAIINIAIYNLVLKFLNIKKLYSANSKGRYSRQLNVLFKTRAECLIRYKTRGDSLVFYIG
jgi:hypothetical protein